MKQRHGPVKRTTTDEKKYDEKRTGLGALLS